MRQNVFGREKQWMAVDNGVYKPPKLNLFTE
jgi:hypothetical protein